MRLYVIGPVTGIEGGNRSAFEEAREDLRQHWDCEVMIPHDTVPEDASWEQAMRLSIATMMSCDAVSMLPGWSTSKGASIEYNLARRVGLPTMPFKWWSVGTQVTPTPS